MSRLTQLAGVLSLPPTLAHEATHWAVARHVTDDAKLAVEVTGGRAVASWSPIANPLWRACAYLAPTLVGGVLLGLWIASGVSVEGLWEIPRITTEAFVAVIAMPSGDDLRGAFGKQAVQQEM